MNASELVSNVLLAIGPGALLDDARETMIQCKVRHLPVLDDGQVVGMVSDRDISIVIGRIQQPNCVFETDGDQSTRIPMHVQSIMSAPVWCVEMDSDAGEIVDMMLEYRISALPVTNRGRHIGVITTIDMLQCFLDCCERQPYCQFNRDNVAAHMSDPQVVAELGDYAQIVLASMVRTQSCYTLVVLDDRLVGIISDRDLRKRLGVTIRGSLDIYPHLHVSHDFTTAGHIMTPNPHTTTPDTPLKQAVVTMLKEKVGALPVVNSDGTVAGLLGATDIMRMVRTLVTEEDAVMV